MNCYFGNYLYTLISMGSNATNLKLIFYCGPYTTEQLCSVT